MQTQTGNNPSARGRLAQLVQSICLTSRGSAVRIRQRPPLKMKHLRHSRECFLIIWRGENGDLRISCESFLVFGGGVGQVGPVRLVGRIGASGLFRWGRIRRMSRTNWRSEKIYERGGCAVKCNPLSLGDYREKVSITS